MLGAAAAVAAALHVPLQVYPIGCDQGIWLTAGMGLAHGKTFFHDLLHFNLPGTAVVYGLASAVTDDPRPAVALLSAAATILISVGIYLLLSETFSVWSGAWAALIFASLWPLYLNWRNIAQKDFLGLPWILLATWCVARAGPDRRFYKMSLIGTGLFVAFAGQFKPTLLAAGLLIGAGLLWRNWRARRAAPDRRGRAQWIKHASMEIGLCAAGGVLGFLPLFLHLALGDGLTDAYYGLFVMGPGYLGLLKKSFFKLFMTWLKIHEGAAHFKFNFSLVLVAAYGLGLVIWLASRRWRKRFWLLVPILTVFGSFVLQRKGARYHLDPWYAVMCIFIGISLGWAWRKRNLIPFRKATLIYLVVGLVGLAGFALSLDFSFEQKHGIKREYRVWRGEMSRNRYLTRYYSAKRAYPSPRVSEKLARWLRDNSKRRDKIVVWGIECQIYPLARRMYATQTPFNQCLVSIPIDPGAKHWLDRQRKLFLERLETEAPLFFVVTTQDKGVIARHASDELLKKVPGLPAYLEAHYSLVAVFERFLVYRRNPPASAPNPI